MNEFQGHDIEETPGKAPAAFHGYPPPYSNTIYTPNQFLSVVLPHASLNCIRLVAYLIEMALAWADGEEEPSDGMAWVPYSKIAKESSVSRSKLQSAIDEGIENRYLVAERFGSLIIPKFDGYQGQYALKWNTESAYTESAVHFDGFFGGPDGKDGNRTHIPKSFFNYTIPNETKSVIQVVGAIMRHTIGFELKKGYRRKLVKMSWKRLQSETRIGSPNTLKDALDRAIKGQHIELLEEGVFDPQAGVKSRPAVYTLKWTDGAYMGETKRPEVVELGPALERRFPKLKRDVPKTEAAISQNDSGVNVPEVKRQGLDERPKSEAVAVPNLNREASQKRSDIEITSSNNLSKTQQRCAAVVGGPDDFIFSLIELLRSHGLSYDASRKLIEKSTEDVIRRQCAWIDKRPGIRNKAAFLWTAITEDMPEPAQHSLFAQSPEEEFVEGFYEGWSGSSQGGLVPASPSEIPVAMRLIQGIERSVPGITPRDAGARFGHYARANQKESKTSIASFTVQARSHGYAFVDSLAKSVLSEKKAQWRSDRDSHELANQPEYLAFLDALEERIAQDNPEAYEEFMKHEEQERERISQKSRFGGERIVARRLEYFETPEAKRERFVEFFSAREGFTVPEFWEWDSAHNPTPFTQEQPQ